MGIEIAEGGDQHHEQDGDQEDIEAGLTSLLRQDSKCGASEKGSGQAADAHHSPGEFRQRQQWDVFPEPTRFRHHHERGGQKESEERRDFPAPCAIQPPLGQPGGQADRDQDYGGGAYGQGNQGVDAGEVQGERWGKDLIPGQESPVEVADVDLAGLDPALLVERRQPEEGGETQAGCYRQEDIGNSAPCAVDPG